MKCKKYVNFASYSNILKSTFEKNVHWSTENIKENVGHVSYMMYVQLFDQVVTFRIQDQKNTTDHMS